MNCTRGAFSLSQQNNGKRFKELSKKVKKIIAFTLAEVLVTLTIDGIVAATTIPSIMQTTQNAELEVKFKKTYSYLSQITNSLSQDNGGNLGGLFANNIDIMNAFGTKLILTKTCLPNIDPGICWHNGKSGWKMLDGRDGWSDKTGEPRAITSDGTLIVFGFINSCNTASRCGVLTIDINGFKGTNVMGRDIFELSLFPTRLMPSGVNNDLNLACNIKILHMLMAELVVLPKF